MSDADCTPGREPRSVAASLYYNHKFIADCQTQSVILRAQLYRLLCNYVQRISTTDAHTDIHIITTGSIAYWCQKPYAKRECGPMPNVRDGRPAEHR